MLLENEDNNEEPRSFSSERVQDRVPLEKDTSPQRFHDQELYLKWFYLKNLKLEVIDHKRRIKIRKLALDRKRKVSPRGKGKNSSKKRKFRNSLDSLLKTRQRNILLI